MLEKKTTPEGWRECCEEVVAAWHRLNPVPRRWAEVVQSAALGADLPSLEEALKSVSLSNTSKAASPQDLSSLRDPCSLVRPCRSPLRSGSGRGSFLRDPCSQAQHLLASSSAEFLTATSPPERWRERLVWINTFQWHLEERAHQPHTSDSELARLKRQIDRSNQRRCQMIEWLDLLLLLHLGPDPEKAPLHTETPAMVMDRLSVLELKRFHLLEERQRGSSSAERDQATALRLALAQEQLDNLEEALGLFWQRLLEGQSRFRLYLQLKLYR